MTGYFRVPGSTTGQSIDEILADMRTKPRPLFDGEDTLSPILMANSIKMLSAAAAAGLLDKAEQAVEAERIKREVNNYDSAHCTAILKRMVKLAPPDVLDFPNPDGGEPILRSDLERDAGMKIIRLLQTLPPEKRIPLMHKVGKALKASKHEVTRERIEAQHDLDHLRNVERILNDFTDWTKAPPRLEKPNGSVLHKLKDALNERRVISTLDTAAKLVPATCNNALAYLEKASVFVVQHDWSSAFAGAKDFDKKADINLPFDKCVFEFRISGRSVIAMVFDDPGNTPPRGMMVAVASGDYFVFDVPEASSLYALLDEAVYAMVIALEADVATTDVVEPPHKLNHSRMKRGRAPLVSYHVIDLSRRRSRGAALLREPSDEPGHRKRLHFRRGHWSHYGIEDGSTCQHAWKAADAPSKLAKDRERHFCTCGAWRTWRKWTLVGDPDLGWVDKEYRL